MYKLGKILITYWPFFLGALLLITAFFGFSVTKLRVEEGEETWYSDKNPTYKTYRDFIDTFESDEYVIVAYRSEDIFSEKELTYLDYLTGRLEKLTFVEEVQSLTTIEDVFGTFDGLDIKKLIEEIPLSAGQDSEIRQRITKNPFMAGTLLSDDSKIAACIIRIQSITQVEESNRDTSFTGELITLLDEETKSNGREFYIGGTPVLNAEVNKILASDTTIFFPLSFFISAVILLLLFRNLGVIICSLFTVFLSILWAMGLKGILGSPVSPITPTLIPLINVIGIATSIHLLSYYKISLQKNLDKKQAICQTIGMAGYPCFLTTITTAIGFASLGVSKIQSVRHMGLFAAFGIFSSFCIALVLMTICMAFFINADTFKVSGQKGPVRIISALLDRIHHLNTRFPRIILTVSFFLFVLFFAGIFLVEVEGSLISYLKKDNRFRKGVEFMDRSLTFSSSFEIVIKGEHDFFKNPEALEKIAAFQEEAALLPEVKTTLSIADLLKVVTRALNEDDQEYYTIPGSIPAVAQSLLLYEMSGGDLIESYLTFNYETARISLRIALISAKERQVLKKNLTALLERHFENMDVTITGFEELLDKNSDYLVTTQIQSFGLAFGIILLIMVFLFGFKGSIISIIPNIFPIVCLLGLMGLAGFHLNIATSLIAAIAIGIVVDDTIHVFTHFRQEMKSGITPVKAVENSLHKVGIAVLFTSVVLIMGFFIFTFSSSLILITFGLLSSFSIFIALLGDLFIGPILLVHFKIFTGKKRESPGKK